MILQMVLWIGLIAGVVLLIVWVIRRNGLVSTPVSGYAIANPQTAKDILQARYARGEINREQYQQMLNDLS
jgi:putative membrane protein